jgi:hypothetical protein
MGVGRALDQEIGDLQRTTGVGSCRQRTFTNHELSPQQKELAKKLVDKLKFTPIETRDGMRYEVTGRLAIGGLLRLPADPSWSCPPGGTDHSGSTKLREIFGAIGGGFELGITLVA